MYYAVTVTLLTDELGTRIAYGIAAIQNGKTVASVSDVSSDKAFVEELVRKFNDAELSPLHLYDVIQDCL